MKTKNIAVLGSTGSIGTQTLEVIRNNDDMRVVYNFIAKTDRGIFAKTRMCL